MEPSPPLPARARWNRRQRLHLRAPLSTPSTLKIDGVTEQGDVGLLSQPGVKSAASSGQYSRGESFDSCPR